MTAWFIPIGKKFVAVSGGDRDEENRFLTSREGGHEFVRAES
jgi:hypothetical protein